MTSPALRGIRVLEVARGMAGEMAGMVLADSGADVLKLEPPGGTGGRAQAGFRVWNRGKRSAVADLATAEGRDVLSELARDADALVTDLRAGTVERLGLGYEGIHAINPTLVYVTISGFGERGPLAGLPGYEYMVSARSGRMADQPTVAGPRPAFTPTPICSFGASMLAIQGLLAGLRHRDRGAGGQRVHTSLVHALVVLDMTSGHGHRIHTPDTSGKVYGVMPVAFMTAECKDGAYLQMCSRFPHLFRSWLRVLGLEHYYDDPAYAQMPDVFPSQAAMDELIAAIRERMAARTRDEWLEIFLAEGVGANPFLAPEDFLFCEQAIVNGNFAEVQDPDAGVLRQVGPIARFSETPAVIGAGAPRLGENGAPAGARPGWHSGRRWGGGGARAGGNGSGAPRYPLDDITILELAFAYATPFSATLLGEMGARVIKVEPPQGDPARRNWRTNYSKEVPGKESVIVDLKTPEGRQIVYDLAAKADVLIHNFRPGVPERLKVDYETLRAINERLIYVYGSCYGSTGPWSHLPGFHSSPNAISGTGILESGVDNPPQNRTFGDPAGAFALAATIMVALHARDATGTGQYVEGTMLGSLSYAVSHYSIGGGDFDRPPLLTHAQRGFGPWCRLYDTADGQLLLCAPRSEDRVALVKLLHGKGFSVPEEGPGADVAAAEVADALSTAFASASADDWESSLLTEGIPAVRADNIGLFDFMLRSEHMRANGLSIEDDVEGVGRIWRSSGAVEFSAAPLRIASPVPLGHDTDRVLAELGRSPDELTRLRAAGVTEVVGQGL